MALAVIFGGRSCEHDVSIVTGVQAACELKSRGSLPIYVDTDGNWHTGRDLFSVAGARAGKKLKRVYMRPGSSVLYTLSGRELAKIDEAVLCCHGAGGEDGSLQGLMELCGVPYTCSGLLPSAVCLDKAEFKARASAMGFPVLPYVVFARAEWNGDICSVADRLNSVGYPFIVKPARQGSSIGVGKAENEAELVACTRNALCYDDKIVAERLLKGFREFNCAALGDENDVTVSCVEEPIGWKDFLTYADKYAGKAAVKRRMPADIPEDLAERIRDMTRSVFLSFGLSGVARIDYLLSSEGELYVNEANTVPGSLASYLFVASGMTIREFYRRLLGAAKNTFAKRNIRRFAPPVRAGK